MSTNLDAKTRKRDNCGCYFHGGVNVVDIYGGKSPRDMAIYSVARAAQILSNGCLRTSSSTVRRWATTGLFRPASSAPLLLSFNNLVEVLIIASLRKKFGVPLSRIRAALQVTSQRLGTPRPLLSKAFKTDGARIFVEVVGEVDERPPPVVHELSLKKSAEQTLRERELRVVHYDVSDGALQGTLAEVIDLILKRVDWSEDGPVRFWPWAPHDAVVVDPEVSFGEPVLSGTRVPTSVLAERHSLGESVGELADDYGLSEQQVIDAVEYEAREAA